MSDERDNVMVTLSANAVDNLAARWDNASDEDLRRGAAGWWPLNEVAAACRDARNDGCVETVHAPEPEEPQGYDGLGFRTAEAQELFDHDAIQAKADLYDALNLAVIEGEPGAVVTKWAMVAEVSSAETGGRWLAHRAGTFDGDSPQIWDVLGLLGSGIVIAREQLSDRTVDHGGDDA
jgi:hypothetical protein